MTPKHTDCQGQERTQREPDPGSYADMFINSNVTVMETKAAFINLDHHIETESKLSIWL